MQRRSYELWSALGAMLLITLLYLWVVTGLDAVPPAGDLFGHGLGIAGFLLSTGSALDANILIFERMKEEIRSGRTLNQAMDLGWQRAAPPTHHPP